jgi:hypothetical protein
VQVYQLLTDEIDNCGATTLELQDRLILTRHDNAAFISCFHFLSPLPCREDDALPPAIPQAYPATNLSDARVRNKKYKFMEMKVPWHRSRCCLAVLPRLYLTVLAESSLEYRLVCVNSWPQAAKESI